MSDPGGNSIQAAVDARMKLIANEAEISNLRSSIEELRARNDALARDLQQSNDARADLDHERVDMIRAIDGLHEKRKAQSLESEKKLDNLKKKLRKCEKKYLRKKEKLDEANKEIKVCSFSSN